MHVCCSDPQCPTFKAMSDFLNSYETNAKSSAIFYFNAPKDESKKQEFYFELTKRSGLPICKCGMCLGNEWVTDNNYTMEVKNDHTEELLKVCKVCFENGTLTSTDITLANEFRRFSDAQEHTP
jgi:hypothetical protein